MNDTQMLLLVDENDTFSGQYAEKEKCHQGKGIHHRAFVVLLYNKSREVLLQQRKHIRWDNYWDLTAISHVLHFPDHDETYEEAAHRSLQVEMGIPEIPLTNVGGFNYYAKYGGQCENEFCAVLLGTYDGKITPDKDVLYTYAWLSEDTFFADIKRNPKKYTPWAIKSVPFINKL